MCHAGPNALSIVSCSVLGPAVTFRVSANGQNVTTADVAEAAGKAVSAAHAQPTGGGKGGPPPPVPQPCGDGSEGPGAVPGCGAWPADSHTAPSGVEGSVQGQWPGP